MRATAKERKGRGQLYVLILYYTAILYHVRHVLSATVHVQRVFLWRPCAGDGLQPGGGGAADAMCQLVSSSSVLG